MEGATGGCKRLARLSYKLEETHISSPCVFSYSVRLRKEISRPAAGCGDVRGCNSFRILPSHGMLTSLRPAAVFGQLSAAAQDWH